MKNTTIIYTDTTSKEAVADFMERQRRHRQQEHRRKQRRWYFIKQRLWGFFLIVLTILAVKMLDGDATIAIITIPLGLVLIFSRKMLVMNDYYFETEKRQEGNEGRTDRR